MPEQQHPPSPVPYDPKAFHQPTPEELAQNKTYYQGYAAGQNVCTGIPGPAGACAPTGNDNYAYYRSWVEPCLLPPATDGFPNQVAVGYNNALLDWANWLWTHDDLSPHKVPCPGQN